MLNSFFTERIAASNLKLLHTEHGAWKCYAAVVAVAPLNYIIKRKIDVLQVLLLEKGNTLENVLIKVMAERLWALIINILPCGGFRGKLCVSFNFSALM